MSKVYCAFQFFNELDILKIKIEELYNVVDYFVVSESTKTHSGNSKPLYFKENQHLFMKYMNKIIYQKVTDTPDDYSNLDSIPSREYGYNVAINKIKAHTHYPKNVLSYCRDSFEKEILIRPLMHCSDDDIIILGDCDEIPKASSVLHVIKDFNVNNVYRLQHDFYWYYLNVIKSDETWFGNMIMSYKMFKDNSFCAMRDNKNGNVFNAGWHFSYQKGIDSIKHKIESWGEQSLNQDWVKNSIKNNVENCLTSGVDLFGRPAKFEKINITYETHPKYLVEHKEEFKDMIL